MTTKDEPVAASSWRRLKANPPLGGPAREREWETVYGYLWPRLVAGFAGRYGIDHAQDGAQHALLQLVRKNPMGLSEIDDCLRWTMTASRNFIIDSVRRESRLAVLDEADTASELPGITLELLELQRLEEEEGLLSERERALLRMLRDGEPVEHIADSLGLTRSSAVHAIHKLRKMLKLLTKKNFVKSD